MARYYPDLETFITYTRRGNTIPVYRQLLSDSLTPVSAYRQIAGGPDTFLLESVVGGERIGRYSFAGANPLLTVRAKGRNVRITQGDTVREFEADNPMACLADELKRFKAVHPRGLPRFTGGAVGYAGYDVIRYFERLPDAPTDDRRLADMHFAFYDTMVLFDHIDKTVKVVANAMTEGVDPRQAYEAACRKIDRLVEQLQQPVEQQTADIAIGRREDLRFTSSFTKKEFEAAVETCKEYIRAGDIFQVVLSQRLEVETRAHSLDIYRALRVINPSPFMFHLKAEDVELVGASPEIMVRVEDGLITNRPLAGTRPRGATPEEDDRLEAELLADPKERAEHIMLVDLARNDVGRVAEFNSVRLADVLSVERYSHVMHITSNVEGRLKAGMTALDALVACLPVGTVSGAPKVRAMEIIDELEKTRRGPYAGAVGYVDFSGNMDTCIALRTMVIQGNKVYVQAGAGLVADSVPEREYEETLNKALALLLAVRAAEETFAPGV
ncbi:MAG: anthranilate synthase component I [Planctomycetes bacterium]|nr:anthranilate synthase component I [Planctomycetota bacterium]